MTQSILIIACLLIVPLVAQLRQWKPASLFALVALLYLMIGAIQYLGAGITVSSAQGNPPKLHDTYYVVSHFHYQLFLILLFGFFAALLWLQSRLEALFYPRMTKVLFWLLHLGLIAAFAPTLVFLWMFVIPNRFTSYPSYIAKLDLISTLGATLSLIAALAILALFLWSLAHKWRKIKRS